MAAGVLAKPGSRRGPCLKACEHRDCAATREIAASICRICKMPIGYDVGFYMNYDPPGGYVHSVCYENEIEAKQKQKEKRSRKHSCPACGYGLIADCPAQRLGK
jgi:hypothetical protein